ncbi:MAG: SIS domain-containing protein [Gemmatimonadetes bacterium]|nr:SIS domain-containing protein [Gemmatimonadota bacterium]
MSYTQQYLAAAAQAIEQLDRNAIEAMVQLVVETRQRGGRLFVLGVGGSAGNASHAVNDFRKIAGIESYAPTDNVSELTARINDEGWDTAFAKWLEGSRLNEKDLILILSVGGGNRPLNTSVNLVVALEYAREVGAKICGIVGRDGGFTAQVADACAIVPTVAPDVVTPLTESFQAVIWHLIVSHPEVQVERTRW